MKVIIFWIPHLWLHVAKLCNSQWKSTEIFKLYRRKIVSGVHRGRVSCL
jgi:hypothetical protein